jgi:Zn-dependent protease/predicted transcriptional regulator
MRWSARVFSIRGIDVRVHATFLLIVLLGAWQWGARSGAHGALFGAGFMLALFACVLLHELGHSFAAQHFGLKVKEILLLPIGGVATLHGGPTTPRQEVIVALAGPAVNVVLAAVFAGVLWLTGSVPTTLEQLSAVRTTPSLAGLLLLLVSGNATLALFNLLPVFPLDGGRVLKALLEMRWGVARATAWAAGVGQVASLGLLGYALLSGQLLLGVISVFVFIAAGQENLQAQLRTPLETLTAGDVAELPAVDLDASMRVRDAIPWLLRTRQSSFPVVSGDRVLGVVQRAELLALASRPEAELLSVRAIMHTAPELDAELPLGVALERMREQSAAVAVIMASSQPVGLLAEPQVLAKLAQGPQVQWKKPSVPTRQPSRAHSALDPS